MPGPRLGAWLPGADLRCAQERTDWESADDGGRAA